MKVLVTGGSGYIGSVLVPRLIQNGHQVVVVDRFFFGDSLQEDSQLTKIKADSRDLDKSYFKGIDAVIDLVAMSNDPSGEAFSEATYQINHQSRVNTAILAKDSGVQRYILPSSCSIYGFQEEGYIADESSKTNPLTVYAKANEMAEKDILPLADSSFTATVIRQATVYGFSKRMRFDLAINGMTHGAWETRQLPLMRDGTQWRPMIHVKDTSEAMIYLLTKNSNDINGEIFNVGSESNVYQLGALAERVAKTVGDDVAIEWYGDKDIRSYNVSFKKLADLGFKTKYKAEDGVKEILSKLESGELEKTKKTITLEWYSLLSKWHSILQEIDLNGTLINR